MDDVWKQSWKKTWCKTQVGPGSWHETRASRMNPRCCLAILNSGVLLVSFQTGLRERHVISCRFHANFRCSAESSDPVESHHFLYILVLCFFFPRLFLTRSYRKGFERWEASGPGWAGLRFRKGRNQTSIPLNGFPFELQQIGKLEAFLIHNSSQVPHAFGITIFCGCKL